MPATSVSSITSWGAYFMAAMALLFVMTPVLDGVRRGSDFGVEVRHLEGVSALLRSLTPGVVAHLWYGSPGDPGAIVISGSTIFYEATHQGPSEQLGVPARDAVIYPGVPYVAQLVAGYVVIAPG
ncbi:MAG: hypothetical protein HY247_02215 [archaeon]|nr:MAG: hypothetical protein HY247_02215 [archaeon]